MLMNKRIVIAFFLFPMLPIAVGAQRARAEHWVTTWGTAVIGRPVPSLTPPAPAPATTTAAPAPQRGGGDGQRGGGGRGGGFGATVNVNNQTIRQIVHTSVGGSRIRVVLSNVFGTAPVVIGAGRVALRASESSIVPAFAQALTFGGRDSVLIPAGAIMLSDPLNLTVASFADLAIDLYLPGDTSVGPVTIHGSAIQRNYVSKDGNAVGVADIDGGTAVPSWFLLSRVEVVAPEAVSTIVTFGDSITDGTASTVGANHRWPDYLAKRLGGKFAILNAGIAGNRLLSDGLTPAFGINALARFERDVLAQPGISHVIVLEGINDIGMATRGSPTPAAEDLIAAHQQLIERAHARGLKIFGATLTPFEGAAYFSPLGETRRQAVNTWIRTSKAYDGVIDFDAAVRDPKQPGKFQPQFNSGDNLHPSDAGYEAMANAIDLKLLSK
jgi:lysophospholipase L1-like esterase